MLFSDKDKFIFADCLKIKFKLLSKKLIEFLFKTAISLSFKLKWPKVKFWGLNIVSGLPTVTKYPEPILELYGFISYGLAVIVIVWFIVMIKAILNYFGRLDFAKTVAKEKFFRSLEDPNDLKNLD